MSFGEIESIPEDPLFEVGKMASADEHPDTVNGVIGVAREDGKPFVLKTVKKVIKDYPTDSFEYLPISGDSKFLQLSKGLIIENGENFSSIGTPGGTGALYVGFSFLSKLIEDNKDIQYKVIIPESVWGNTLKIAERGGIEDEMIVRQGDNKDGKFDKNYIDIEKTSTGEKQIFLFHATCKNPDGIDPTNQQWDDMAKKIKKSGGIAFFDIAYQGFGGTLEEDSYAIKAFEKEGIPMLVAQSFSKNFSLYKQRTGALHVSNGDKLDKNIQPLLNSVARSTWSNPPALGEHVVAEILSNPELKEEWEDELTEVRENILAIRELLSDIVPGILDRKGMFDNILIGKGTKDEQIKNLREKHIYTANDGRINLGGITLKQAEYIKNVLETNIK